MRGTGIWALLPPLNPGKEGGAPPNLAQNPPALTLGPPLPASPKPRGLEGFRALSLSPERTHLSIQLSPVSPGDSCSQGCIWCHFRLAEVQTGAFPLVTGSGNDHGGEIARKEGQLPFLRSPNTPTTKNSLNDTKYHTSLGSTDEFPFLLSPVLFPCFCLLCSWWCWFSC